jgi:hypothetical protein
MRDEGWSKGMPPGAALWAAVKGAIALSHFEKNLRIE